MTKVNDVLGVDESAMSPKSVDEGGEATPKSQGNRYGNLVSAGETLGFYGGILKVVALVMVAGGSMTMMVSIDAKEWGYFFAGLAVVSSGIGAYISGLFIAAAGEAAGALADIATAIAGQKKICPECGIWIMNSVRTCGKCGFKFF